MEEAWRYLLPVTKRMPKALKRRRRRHNKRVLYRADPAARIFGLRRDLLNGRPITQPNSQ